MARTGRKVQFHGAFTKKSDAVRKERKTAGAYIQPITVKGHRRYAVITRKGR